MGSSSLNSIQTIEKIEVEEINEAIGEFQLKSNGKTLMKRAQMSYFLFGQVAVNKVVVFWIPMNNSLERKVPFPTYNGYILSSSRCEH